MTPAIEIRAATPIPFQRIVRLALHAVRHRLVRSALTTAVVVLAVAFFASMWAENRLLSALRRGVGGELWAHRAAPRLLSHLFKMPGPAHLAEQLAGASPAYLKEAAGLTRWPMQRIDRLAGQAALEQQYSRYFDRLPGSKRIVLLRLNEGPDIFAYLASPEGWAAFNESLTSLPEVRLPGGPDALRAFLGEHPHYTAELLAYNAALSTAHARLDAELIPITGTTPVLDWLAASSAPQAEAWADIVRAAGFTLSREDVSALQHHARLETARLKISLQLAEPAAMQGWQREFRERIDPDEKLRVLDRREVARLFGDRWPAATVGEVAREARRNHELGRLEAALVTDHEEMANDGLSSREVLLLSISFLVCLVGVSNAMLMAITERFREIATMKCLGATDGCVLKLFLIEATFHGAVGGVAGALIGLLVAGGKAALVGGLRTFTYMPAAPIAGAAVASCLLGVLLAMLASLYPAWAASRMPPMEAMRVE